ncbi:MAG: hypothetical protein LBT70_01960 [Holosporaceae bacterium]|jgi:undecaprenyl-diphosphatase|nr:hypothetical protein [Holosporaceae bacterium]
MFDWCVHSCLKIGHITFILPITVLGMIFHQRKLYEKAACFLLFAMIFNTLLKHLFRVPLFPHLGEGYAFPSGHMHAAAMFYGYILYQMVDRRIKMLLAIILMCEGFSLIYCKFHDLLDVLGALGFAVAEIFCYHLIVSKFKEKGEKYATAIAIAIALGAMIILSIIYRIENHVWLAFYGLCGLFFSLSQIADKKLKTLLQKFWALLIASLFCWLVYMVFKNLNFRQNFLFEIKFALLPIIVAGSIKYTASRFATL